MTITSSPTSSKSSGRRANALPVGCMLDEYRIDSILGAGGFGVTYKALDTHLDTWVAIKEYFPVEWSFRDSDGVTVYPNTQGDASGSGGELSDYRWGLERFLDEARVLARIQHPYVVRVKRYFQAHGTAYIVMDYEEGQPLSMILREEEKLNEEEVRGLLEDVLPALRAVHEQGYLHRDIKPSNLYVRASDHRVILIDFGAARQAVGRHSQSVTSLVTPGYSPPEQYTTRNDRYGAWTDIYALGAVLYRCITGHTPTDAADRLLDDSLEPAVKVGAGRYSTNLLRVIDRMLAVRPDQRFSTVVEAQAALAGSQDDDSDETVIMLPITPVKPVQAFETSRITRRPAKPAAGSTRPEAQQPAHLSPKPPVEPDHSEWLQFTQAPARPPSAKQPQKPPQGSASQWRLIAFVGGGAALAALAALLIWLGLSEPAPTPTVESKPPPRYHLGQQQPAVADSPAPPEAPVSTPTPPESSPTTSDVVADTPTPVENTETTSALTPPAEPVVGSESEPATGESMQETVGLPDLPIDGDADGASQPTVTERAPEITDTPEPPATPDVAESAGAEKAPETTGAEESTTGTAGIPVAVPGTIPAKITPKADASTEPATRRAVTEKPKTPRKTQRTQRTTRKDPRRPWKVIPYDPSAKKPAQADSTRTTPRSNRWSDPGSSGFNQK